MNEIIVPYNLSINQCKIMLDALESYDSSELLDEERDLLLKLKFDIGDGVRFWKDMEKIKEK